MRIVNHSSIAELMAAVGFKDAGVIDEDDIDTEDNECERFGRKRRDGEILSTLAANTSGIFLDIGTSHGRSAYKLARNAPGSTIHTVNALPEQLDQSAGNLVTHSLVKDQIGIYFREKNIANIIQHYANTQDWTVPPEIDDLSFAFIDGAHDKDCVYRDTINAYERLKPGGVIAWHDFSQRFRDVYSWIDEVMSAVEYFIENEHLHDAEIHCLDYSWIGFLKKPVKKPNIWVLGGTTYPGNPPPAMVDMKKLRYLVVYPNYSTARTSEENSWTGRIRNLGYSIEIFPIPCPEGWLHFPELDRRYRNRDSGLMKAYDDLSRCLESYDVLIASSGAMLHPEFVRQLPVYSVWISADDPESSEILSQPAAPAFDFAFSINPACLDMFRSWGCQEVDWIFSPIRQDWLVPSVTEEKILFGDRSIDACFLGARITPTEDRLNKIQALTHAVPNAIIRGTGWPGDLVRPHLVYPNTKIGWNITNNNVGPNNTRTYHLPATGVLQICDNPAALNSVFKLDQEVVGYETITECIDKTRYYLAHDKERREIAARGWRKCVNEYSEQKWWERLIEKIATSYMKKLVRDAASHEFIHASDNDTVEMMELGSSTSSIKLSCNYSKAKVLLLVDRPGWAFDAAAKAVAQHLADEFEFRICYVVDQPDLSEWPFDIIHVFFWGETYHQSYVMNPLKIIKEVSSHRWGNEKRYGCLTPLQMVNSYLYDAATTTCTSRRLEHILAPFCKPLCYTPNGVDTSFYHDFGSRNGTLHIGWAGNAADPCKGLNDILLPSAGTDFTLKIASGDMNHREMLDFYNSIDVLCVASTEEGEPLTLLEAMACGCFPVCVNVGIVPELVVHGQNGLVIARSIASFRAAFQWCVANVDYVREAGRANADLIKNTRSWKHVIGHWRIAFNLALSRLRGGSHRDVLPSCTTKESQARWQHNLGDKLLEWPKRAEVAAEMIKKFPLEEGGTLIDLGCGHQTLRQLLPSFVRYIPVDRVQRTPDTIVMDLTRERPTGKFNIAVMLGLLEYFASPEEFISWVANHTNYAIISFNDCSNTQKRQEQHWNNSYSLDEIERVIRNNRGEIIQFVDMGKNERIYAVSFSSSAFELPLNRVLHPKRLALFSAAVQGDNSGDALIVDAIKKLLAGNELHTFPLLQPLSFAQLEQVNACDMAIICGTNLYQSIFACALTAEKIGLIKIPIFPLGVGASAPIGSIPVMDEAGIKAVRMIHERCVVSSVRDPSSLAFVRGLGIRNVELTGCPVLFHAGKEPNFRETTGSRVHLSIRARLLHVEEELISKEMQTLHRICHVFRPVLVIQSPYDIPLAQELASRYRLEILHDQYYGHEPLVNGVRQACRTIGFRLHFGMLSLSYGKPATLIATDTRVSEFCNMMQLHYHNIYTYDDEALVRELHAPPPDMSAFVSTWRDLRYSMASVLEANGLLHTINP